MTSVLESTITITVDGKRIMKSFMVDGAHIFLYRLFESKD